MKQFLSVSILFIAVFTLSASQTKIIITKNNGTSEAILLSDIKGISFKSNLIKNGDFNDSLKNWILIGKGINPYHPQDHGRADFSVINGVLTVNITNQGTWEFSIMVYQSVPFEKDASYIVTFDAMADSSVQIISNIVQDVTWTNFSGDIKCSLTTVMASYSYEFTMPAAGSALFQFCLGNIGLRKLYFDNITIRKK